MMLRNSMAHKILAGQNPLGESRAFNDIEFTDQLSNIKVPTLITCGYFDMITPTIAKKNKRPDIKF